MRIIDILRMAIGNLKRNKLRTFLTISGVVIGIGSIVFLVSLGFGLQRLATKKVANLDALTLITVNPGNKEETSLTETTVEKFKKLDHVEIVSPILSTPGQVVRGGASSDTVIYGVDPKFFDLEDAKPKWGGKIKEGEKKVVISKAVLENLELKDPEKAIGQELGFSVIQLDERGNIKSTEGVKILLKVAGVSAEEKIKYSYVPLSILKELDGKKFNSIKVRVKKRNDLSDVRKAIESMGYPTTSIKDTVDQIDRAFVIIKSILGGFGFVALFVAAIGIFNTMTISLLERTHEIGIMKAIGGRDKDIARIFTAESSLIGLAGGIFGVLAGWLLGRGINALANFMAASVGGEQNEFFYTPFLSFSLPVIIFSFLVSTISGIWPAKRAARLDPLEALRYE